MTATSSRYQKKTIFVSSPLILKEFSQAVHLFLYQKFRGIYRIIKGHILKRDKVSIIEKLSMM